MGERFVEERTRNMPRGCWQWLRVLVDAPVDGRGEIFIQS